MAPVRTQAVFNASLLPSGERRWGSFGAGLGLECFAVAMLVIFPMLMPQKFEAMQHDWVMPIAAPIIEAWKPQPPPKPVAVKREIVKALPKPEPIVIPKPKIYNPVISSPIRPATPRKMAAPDMTEVAKAFPDPKPPASIGSSAIPTLRKPREEVQTGGFGDPNGVKDNGKRDRNPNIAVVGSYDLPAGPGSGNGTGGSKGAKGVIVSTGFGDGVATGSRGGGSHGTVQQGMFSDQRVADSAPRVRQTAAVSNTKPVEILFKPKPVYTDEARAKKLEGDVLLQVVFGASGEVKIQRIVRGLGYGLDESAEAAARQIRFHPAQQDGQPVDFSAVVHITFELAY